jgi:hypothetical protein
MPQWQYCTIHLNDSERSEGVHAVNAVGKEGWELVVVTRNSIAYFKRPIDTPAYAPDRPQSGSSSRRKAAH